MRLSRLVLSSLLGLAACGDSSEPPEKAKKSSAMAAPVPMAAPAPSAAAAPVAVEQTKKVLLDEVRKRTFKNEDFIESDFNRDPFRSFLSDFSGGQTLNGQVRQYKILLPKFSLDELKLIAIIGPPTESSVGGKAVPARAGEEGSYTQARAMFLDPAGMGVPIVRGDHISKADAKVVRVDGEKGKVYVELKEDLGSGKTAQVERVLELHQGEPTEGATP